ncbi:glycosyltransferase family 2 protein [Flagellimonas lutimaris]|uniref:Glycosyltransferase family 2 protein n=1 Tax=Flagellimonas lutimaris TaxID=475082 RepID=A0A3A1N2Z9_9FLAO|nr:glycosyltransferase [Allomuricauda lutimaris]RIV30525.1 glycosyltransferase family 2 protein [Allomuricauda lutimaris]
MYRIAVLLTCHNRKEKTLSSLKSLKTATQASNQKIDVTVYLTDDGSTDGTSEAVASQFPDTVILKGDGNLFWANGMINSWKEAIKKDFDFYLLLNDDTILFDDFFDVIFDTHHKCLDKYGMGGVYVGSTKDSETQEISYGGAVIISKLKYTFSKIKPDGNIHECDLGNANIMMVSKNVVEKVGILSDGYAHGAADFDYTLKSKKKGMPVLVATQYCGYCTNDHKGMYHNFDKKSLKERIDYLYSPTGIAFKSRLRFMRKFFPVRYPFFFIVGWVKVLFPKIYVATMTSR